MPAHYTSHISFDCPICEAPVRETVDVPGTDWGGDTADERYTMDSETIGCFECGAHFDLGIGNQDGTIFATLSEHRDVKVKASDTELQFEPEEIDWDLPAEPSLVVISTLNDIIALVDLHGDPSRVSVFNRMAFIQQIAALEAYLCDFLLNQVRLKPAALAAIVKGDRDLKDQKLTLVEVLADAHVVKRAVAEHLQMQLYHKLAKVEAMYRTALGVGLLPNADIKQRLFAAMPTRHDCVHRNGLDKDGARRLEVRAGFLRQIDADIRAVVTHMEGRID